MQQTRSCSSKPSTASAATLSRVSSRMIFDTSSLLGLSFAGGLEGLGGIWDVLLSGS